MATATYDYGETVTLTAEFRNDLGVLIDPTNVKLLLTKPDGTALSELNAATPYTSVYAHSGTGSFEYSFTPDMAGTWVAMWSGVSSNIIINEYYFVMRANGKSGWSYSGDPSSSAVDEVRFLLGDTDPADPIFSDVEIQYLYNQNGNAYLAAIRGCQGAAMKYGRLVTQTVGPFTIQWGQKQQQLLGLAGQLTAAYGSAASAVAPAWSGPSSDPIFKVGMTDNPNSLTSSELTA